MDNGFGYWLAGFIDGEGSFKISRARKAKTYSCRFNLCLRDDDRGVLEQIQSETGLGLLYVGKPYNGSKPQLTWEIRRKSDCQDMVSLLDRYPLRSRKVNDYVIWRDAVHLWSRVTSTVRDQEIHERFAELKIRLEAVRRYKGYERPSEENKD